MSAEQDIKHPDAVSQDNETICRILIVEDNPDHSELIRAVYQDQPKYNLDFADSIATAFRLLTTNQYEVVLTDYRLPDGRGTDLIEWAPGSSMIIMTSQGNEEVAVDALKRGAYDYLVKNSMFADLIVDAVERARTKFQFDKEIRMLKVQLSEAHVHNRQTEIQLQAASRHQQTMATYLESRVDESLGRLNGYIDTIMEELAGPLTARQRECLGAMKNICRKIQDDISDLSSRGNGSDSTSVRLNRGRVNANTLLASVARTMHDIVECKNQVIDLHLDSDNSTILGDSELLHDALYSLILSIHRYAEFGSRIRIDLRASQNEPDSLCCTLSYSQETAGTPQPSVYNIIEKHGGKLMKSNTNNEIKMWFALPLYDEAKERYAFIEDYVDNPSGLRINPQVVVLSMPPVHMDGVTTEEVRGDCLRLKEELHTALAAEKSSLFHDSTGWFIVCLTQKSEDTCNKKIQALLNQMPHINNARRSISSLQDIVDNEDWLRQMIHDAEPVFKNDRIRKVLIVDDESNILSMIRRVLITSGMAVDIQTASDGNSAWELFLSFKPDILILDVNIENLNGAEILKRIKADQRFRNTVVIMMSGVPDVLRNMEKIGADICLQKPFDIGLLLNAVKSERVASAASAGE
ncbi:MAG: response regulator [Candidatus Zixiibacteriota bacterium]